MAGAQNAITGKGENLPKGKIDMDNVDMKNQSNIINSAIAGNAGIATAILTLIKQNKFLYCNTLFALPR
jgi:hypothetical protein